MMKFSSLSKLSRLLTILSLVVVSCAFVTTGNVVNSHRNIAAVTTASQSPIDVQGSFHAGRGVRATAANDTEAIVLTDGHSDQCLANYNQCMKGCDGATSCSNQCKTNYDNCMRQ